MKTIISPAKKMSQNLDAFPVQTRPVFLEQAQQLLDFLKTRTKLQLKEIWNASDKIIETNYKHLQEMNLNSRLTPAIICFNGLQYQYMAPDIFTKAALGYLQDNLRILSGFYGILRPFDGVCPYRLEMKSQMVGFKDYSLYHFWDDQLSQELFKDDDLVINLASKEYARAVTPYLSNGRKMITIDFQEKKNDRWRTIATHAKMARGEMVRFIAEGQIKNPADLRDFHDFGFEYCQEKSSPEHYVFRSEFDFKSKFRS